MRASHVSERGQRVEVRRLTAQDREELEALLDTEPGYSLFLRGNLEAFGIHGDFARYWGAFEDGRMRATLMMVGCRAAVYAPTGVAPGSLAEVMVDEGANFVMGRADLVDALTTGDQRLVVQQREEHIFAKLAQTDLREVLDAAPLLADVRRAEVRDLRALADLYTGAAGFEGAARDQVYRTMRGRVTTLRTHVALVEGEAVAAASTSAEARTAAMIGGVWTAPEWRGQGFSTAVVATLSRELLREGRRPYLFYRVDNVPAARVYTKIGFREIGGWMVVYLDRSDCA
jgi:uncharacterized protein